MPKIKVDYSLSDLQMGDLLHTFGIYPKEDWSDDERAKMRSHLEHYMVYGNDQPITINLGKIYLVLHGGRDADALYYYL